MTDEADPGRYGYLSAPSPKAAAISDNGHCAYVSGRPKVRALPTDPQERALARCEELAGEPFRVYAVDDEVVYSGPVGR